MRETEASRLRVLGPDEAPSSDEPLAPDAGLAAKFDLTTGGRVRAHCCFHLFLVTYSLYVGLSAKGALSRNSCCSPLTAKCSRLPRASCDCLAFSATWPSSALLPCPSVPPQKVKHQGLQQSTRCIAMHIDVMPACDWAPLVSFLFLVAKPQPWSL